MKKILREAKKGTRKKTKRTESKDHKTMARNINTIKMIKDNVTGFVPHDSYTAFRFKGSYKFSILYNQGNIYWN